MANTGTLVVENLPRDGTVLVDAKPVPHQATRLSAGRHEVEILAPGLQSHTEQVTIMANTAVRVRFPAQPLTIESLPEAPTQVPSAPAERSPR